MKYISVIILIVLFMGCSTKPDDLPEVSSGKIIRIADFASDYVDPRNVDIWLPEGFNKSNKYAVLYMHDGQMLWDSTKTWNGQEWKVDEVMGTLLEEQKIRDCIVVGIWNNDEYRRSEYLPQRILEMIPEDMADTLIRDQLMGKPQADVYLKFLVKELKPYIDQHFPVYTDASNTFILGSSMGGLISLYALCEYPDVFGGAGCMSTHWPLQVSSDINLEIMDVSFEKLLKYLDENLPGAGEKKIYFDHGSKTLDSLYKPLQVRVDEVMIRKGFNEDIWITMEFGGEAHTEDAWAGRLEIPLKFLLNI